MSALITSYLLMLWHYRDKSWVDILMELELLKDEIKPLRDLKEKFNRYKEARDNLFPNVGYWW